MTIFLTIINRLSNNKKNSNDFVNEKEEFYLNGGENQIDSVEV
jgi:hypothetical protein